jgi:hypothetical protein
MLSHPGINKTHTTLIKSFSLHATIGATLIYRHWSALQPPTIAAGRAAILILFVALLHSASYSLYRDQSAWPRLQPLLRSAIQQQIILFLLCSLVLLSGLTQYLTVIAGAYWAAVAIIITRRPQLTNRNDQTIIRYGFPALFALSLLALHLLT